MAPAQFQSPPTMAPQLHGSDSMARSLSGVSYLPLVRTRTAKTNPESLVQATLRINGTLTSVTQNWTEDEQLASRRLVEFSTERDAEVIQTAFKAVTEGNRDLNLPVVSCIYYERKKLHYITGVEVIVLLEFVLGLRFTTEDKYRIRRNLETFKPLTVAKSNEHDDIYELIMGFPDPKPRNIDKSVKIFLWSTLENILKNIASRYVSNNRFILNSKTHFA
jgi:hypothetical protein